MSVDRTKQAYTQQSAQFLDKYVGIIKKDGKIFRGDLVAFHPEYLNCILSKAKCEGEDQEYHRILISGADITGIYLEEAPFDLAGLAEEIRSTFRQKGSVELYEESGLIVVLGRVRVREDGVSAMEGEEGGPMVDRVRAIYNNFVAKQKAKKVK